MFNMLTYKVTLINVSVAAWVHSPRALHLKVLSHAIENSFLIQSYGIQQFMNDLIAILKFVA